MLQNEVTRFLSECKSPIGNGVELFFRARQKASKGEVTVHPYGFHIIKPVKTDIMQIRIHVWLRYIRPMQIPIWLQHSHDMELKSLVIRGHLLSQFWEVSETPSAEHVLYQAGYSGHRSILKKTQKYVSVSEESEHSIALGEDYEVSSGQFHSVVVPDDISAITLCCMKCHPGSAKGSYVVGDRSGEERYIYERMAVPSENASQVWSLLCEASAQVV